MTKKERQKETNYSKKKQERKFGKEGRWKNEGI